MTGGLSAFSALTSATMEIDTSNWFYGIHSIEVGVVSGSRTVSRNMYTVNKPFSSSVSETLRWQMWGGICIAAINPSSIINQHAKRQKRAGQHLLLRLRHQT